MRRNGNAFSGNVLVRSCARQGMPPAGGGAMTAAACRSDSGGYGRARPRVADHVPVGFLAAFSPPSSPLFSFVTEFRVRFAQISARLAGVTRGIRLSRA